MTEQRETYLHIGNGNYSAPGPRDVHDDMPGLTALEVIEAWKQHSERVEADLAAAREVIKQFHWLLNNMDACFGNRGYAASDEWFRRRDAALAAFDAQDVPHA